MSFFNKIEKITCNIFNNYGQTKPKDQKIPKSLFIHDNVFGTLKFKPYERNVINSPFLQRLTNISQMGLANNVYPGAIHNRFSHSLGVSFISEKIYKEITNRASGRNRTEDINTLKLAGLLHDIGHGPFSHLTEDVITSLSHFPGYSGQEFDKEIYKRVESSTGGRKNFHEYIAYHFLHTDLFKDYLDKIYKGVSIDMELVPLCITGNSLPYKDEEGLISKKFKDGYKTLLIKIINGYSDADKIDYLLRDSQFSGLPLPADTDRLLSFFTIIDDDLGHGLGLGVTEKGARAFNLLLLSKAKLLVHIHMIYVKHIFFLI